MCDVMELFLPFYIWMFVFSVTVTALTANNLGNKIYRLTQKLSFDLLLYESTLDSNLISCNLQSKL